MFNTIGISAARPELRFASMTDATLWSVSDRNFRQMGFLLDGYNFERSTFENCWFALRGQLFGLSNSKLLDSTMMRCSELQTSYGIIKAVPRVTPVVVAGGWGEQAPIELGARG